MKKIAAIILILGIFILFCVFEYIKHIGNTVTRVFTPEQIGVDFNKNGKVDENETICIPDVQTFTSNIKADRTKLAQNLKLTQNDAISLGYLADEYAKDILLDKKVKIKFTGKRTPECRFAEISIGRQKYSDLLLNSGFGIIDGKPYNPSLYLKNLEKAKKLNLVILNKKSGKYHKLDCKYGLKSDDFLILKFEDIQGLEKCRYCFLNKNKKHSRKHKKQYNKTSYPEILKLKDIHFIITDYANHLKPDRNCSHIVCKEFVNLINSANETLDMAIYGWDNIPAVAGAIEKAKARGVKIRIVYDKSNRDDFYPETDLFAQTINEKRSDEIENQRHITNMLMHNKFAISDNKRVFTGSMNFSRTGFSGFNGNNIIIVNSEKLAEIYTNEFNQMFEGNFHTLKTQSMLDNSVDIDNIKIRAYFSPQDKIIVNQVIPLVNSAKKYIYIPAFVFTHKDLTKALINAKNRGVDVKVILDATSLRAQNSTHKILRNGKILLKTENYAGKMHSKSMIIDDKYVITGSMNFSNSGENKNDENCLIIESPQIAKYYRGYFEYMWKKIPNYWLTRSVSAESRYSIGSCSDGIDNDFDGKIDKDDKGCKPKK